MKSTMKKLLALAVVFVLLVTAVPLVLPHASAAGAVPQFSVNSVVVKNGNRFYLNLIAENLVDMQGGALFITYDKTAFKFVRATQAGEENYPAGLNIEIGKTHDDTAISCVFTHNDSFSTEALLLAQLEFESLSEPGAGSDMSDVTVAVDHLFVKQSGKSVNIANQITVAPASVTAVDYAAGASLFTYTKSSDAVTITGYTGTSPYVEIPEKIESLPVTAIAANAFANKTALKQLIIPGAVTQIAQSAFSGASNLERVDVAMSTEGTVRYFSDADGVLYQWSESGETLSLFFYPPASKQVFFHTGDLTSLPKNAFSGSKSLKLIILGAAMKTVEDGAFSNLPNVSKINVETANTAFVSVDGVLFNKGKTNLIRYPAAKTSTSFTVDGSLAAVQTAAFDGVRTLKEIKVESRNQNFKADNGVLLSYKQDILWFYPGAKTETTYTIPSTVTTLADFAFSTATNLKNLYTNQRIRTFPEHFNYLTVPSGLTVRPKGSWTIRVYADSPADTYVKSQSAWLAYDYYSATLQTPSATISVFGASEDISVKVNRNGHVFKNVSAPVTSGDYTFSNDTLVIKKAYLDTLKKSENVGKSVVWTLNFETGAPATFTIYITEGTSVMTGDLDGDGKITAADARTALRASAKLVTLTSAQTTAADVDKDGKITASDARTILRVSAKLQTFPQ
ncbi:MAG: leucine-rich repeat protein [Oscillospiraceae bacterium]|jgi:hypothetical protein|nr:leucine-rich repeat protein [Oscillospiraceae bacterium]